MVVDCDDGGQFECFCHVEKSLGVFSFYHFLRVNIKFYSLIIFHFWLWFGGKYFEGRLVKLLLFEGIISLNGCCCERRPLVYFNSRRSQRRSLKIFKID